MNNLNNMNDLYNKALSAGVFNPGYVLAGIKKLKEFREKRQRKDGITYFKKRPEYDELNELLLDVDEHMGNGYRLNSTPGASRAFSSSSRPSSRPSPAMREDGVGVGVSGVEMDACEYCAALQDSLNSEIMDILELEQKYILGVRDDGTLLSEKIRPFVESVKDLGMTFGEYYGYNRAMQDWLVFVADEDVDEGMAEEFLRKKFFELLKVSSCMTFWTIVQNPHDRFIFSRG